MELRIVLAMLGGMVLGMAALVIAITAGLDLKEIYFLAEFWRSLKAGEYEFEDEEDEEREERDSDAYGVDDKPGPVVLDPVTHKYTKLTDEEERRNEHE